MRTQKNNLIKAFYGLSIAIFLTFAVWWVVNHLRFEPEDGANALLADSYWVLPLLGGITGLWASRKWGGLKSVFGRAILLFSLGLLLQVFGQVVYTYYARVQQIEAPYPSIGDIGFFGSVLIYIAAIYLLAKTAGAHLLRIKNAKHVIALVLPLALLTTSYLVFLRGYEFDWSNKLVPLLDFGYPLGQAIYVSLALLTYLLSRKLLGGIMRNKILLLLAALVVQYAADFTFLYKFSRETYYAGGITDAIYLVAYFLMAIALLRMGGVVENLKKGKSIETNTHQDGEAS